MKIEVKLSLFIFHQLAFFALKSSCVAAQQVQNGLPWITFKMWGIFHLRIRRKRWISSHILLYGTNSNYKNTLKYQKIKWHSKLFWEQKMWYPTFLMWSRISKGYWDISMLILNTTIISLRKEVDEMSWAHPCKLIWLYILYEEKVMEQCRQIVGSFYKTNDYFLNSLACSFHLTKHAAATPLIEFFCTLHC